MKESDFNRRLVEICGDNIKSQIDYLKKFKVKLLEVSEKDPSWKLFNQNNCSKIEDGVYLTIRCGYSGIYQTYNIWNSKENKWMFQSADGSFTIYYKDILLDLENGI